MSLHNISLAHTQITQASLDLDKYLVAASQQILREQIKYAFTELSRNVLNL